MRAITYIVLTGLCLTAAGYPGSEGEKAVWSDAFVNSVGVNVHLHYTDTSYGNFGAVEKGLKDLGTRHIRDGLVDTQWTAYYDRLNELGRIGIKSILITSVKQSPEMLATYPSRVADSFEGYEGPNEYDISGDKDWAATLNRFTGTLFDTVRGNPTAGKFPIVAPSLTQGGSFPQVAAVGRYFDFANLHNYFGGRNPGTRGWGANGYGSYEWNLNLARKAWPGKPIYTTETGYINDLSKPDAVPDVVAGTYLPRLLFLQWMHGIRRTYLYELLDLGGSHTGGDGTFGLLHADFSPKPGYTAVRSVLRLLADQGPEFAAGSLEFSLSGDLTDVDHLLLEKRDGRFFLALWVEGLGWDVDRRVEVAVPTRKILVKTAERVKMKVHRLGEDGGMPSSDLSAGLAQAVEIGDRVVILEISR
jgi:hypothetical protein